MAASGVAGVFITPSHSLPVAERELFVQFILDGDAGFAVLEVAPIAFDRGAHSRSCQGTVWPVKPDTH